MHAGKTLADSIVHDVLEFCALGSSEWQGQGHDQANAEEGPRPEALSTAAAAAPLVHLGRAWP